jgi:hypothetical protein
LLATALSLADASLLAEAALLLAATAQVRLFPRSEAVQLLVYVGCGADQFAIASNLLRARNAVVSCEKSAAEATSRMSLVELT